MITVGPLDVIIPKRAFGYAASGETREQVFHLFAGLGGTGKSTVLQVLAEMLGSYAMKASDSAFVHSGVRSGPEPEIHRLITARFVYASEVDAAARLHEARLRSMTGSESVATRTLWQDVVERKPRFKLFLASNTEPRITENHDGTWRRVLLVRWDQQVAEARDVVFDDRLREEAAGILAWVVRGAVEWYAGGLRPPRQIAEWADAYRRNEDVLGRFLAERTTPSPGARVGATALWQSCAAWLAAEGLPPVGQREFGTEMGARFKRVRDGSGRQSYVGLELRAP